MAVCRMAEGDAEGVKVQSFRVKGERISVNVRYGAALSSVQHIPENWSAKSKVMSRMHAELVCAACYGIESDIYRSVWILAYNLVAGGCLLALLSVNFLSRTLIVVGAQWELYCAFVTCFVKME